MFLGRTSACIYVLDLSKPLAHHPLIAYYRKGKPISKPYPCVRTNEDNFKQCMRTMHSFTSKTKGPLSKLLFLGTHRDKIHKCTSETVEEKNKRLKKIIPLKFKCQVIQFSKDKLVFEINAQNPDDTDKNTTERVRCYITDQCIRRIKADEQKCTMRFIAVFDSWESTETEPYTSKTIIDCLDTPLKRD